MPGLPSSRDITFIPTTTPVPAATMNNIQDCIVALAASGYGIYGDGFDGALTVDGTVTVPWATKVGSVYTLNRDIYPTTLHLSGTAKIHGGGFSVFARDEVICDSSSNWIGAWGNDSVSATGATATATGSVLSGGAGGNGFSTSGAGPGTSGAALANALGGAGNVGNNASIAGQTSGAGGAGTPPAATAGLPRNILARLGVLFGGGVMTQFRGGTGGGGGASANGLSFPGGGGGGGGGVFCIFARKFTLAAASCLTVQGGKGGDGAGVVSTGGAGGGGGGGGALLATYGKSNVVLTAAACCAIGANGAVGVAGGAGAIGVLFDMPMQLQPSLGTPGGGGNMQTGFSAMTSGSSGNTHDFLDIVFSNSFAAATGATGYYVECMLSLTSPTAPGIVLEGIVNKTTTGCRLVFSGDFDGEVRWRAYA